LFALILSLPAVPRAEDIAVIETQRPAEELAPLLRELLGPGGVVAASGGKLVVKADPAGIAEVRAVLNQIDRPPRRLMITVATGMRSAAEGAAGGIGARVRGVPPSRVDIGVQGEAWRNRESGDGLQRVQTLEGQAALIRAGTLVPVPSGYGGVGYRPVTAGFLVTPRVSGERVDLDLAAWSDQINPPPSAAIGTSGANTRLSGRLGEWIEVGGVAATAAFGGGGFAYGGSGGETREDRIFIRVDDLDPARP
jgi:hypothetical protein